MVLTAVFFVSGADSASIVMGPLSFRGQPRTVHASGGVLGRPDGDGCDRHATGRRATPAEALGGLQRMIIVAAAPFVVVLLVLMARRHRSADRRADAGGFPFRKSVAAHPEEAIGKTRRRSAEVIQPGVYVRGRDYGVFGKAIFIKVHVLPLAGECMMPSSPGPKPLLFQACPA